jgi:hypothetical protein
MLHALMVAAARQRKGFNPFRYTGPGAKDLLAGNTDKGYFGEVPVTDLIDGAALAAMIGLTAGTAANTTAPWLKFMHGKKTLFIPKMTYRYDMSWDKIYEAGAVYGVEGSGPFTGNNGPVDQKKILVINNNAYILRLMKGGDANPATVIGGEVDDLMFKLWENDPSGEFWTRQTAAQLGFTGNGQYSWVQEKPASESKTVGGLRVWRTASTAASLKGILTSTSSASGTGSYAWRPVLELIPNDLFVFDLKGIQVDSMTPTLLTVGDVSYDNSLSVFRIGVVGYDTIDQPLEVAGVDAALYGAVARIQVAGYTTEDVLLPIGNVTTTIV